MKAAIQLVWGYLRYRPLAASLSIGLLALGVALLSLLVLLDRQLTRQFEQNLAGIDLVIGAKGSPLQLVTSSIYHADSPTGNIEIKDVKAFGRSGHPLISTAIPLALGDSYKGRRIVGTTLDFLDLYEAKLETGALDFTSFKVIVGAAAASRSGLKVGGTFRSIHGLDDNPDLEHADATPFEVAGILSPTGLVIDDLILTPLQTVWSTHDHTDGGHLDEVADEEHEHDDHEGHDHEGHDHEHAQPNANSNIMLTRPWYEETDKSITALLAKFSGRNTATLNFARNINENTSLMAATPAIVMAQFSSQVASAEDLVKALGAVILLASLLSLLIILLNALREREGELSLLRALGARPGFVFRLVLLESTLLAITGAILGLILGRVGFFVLSQQLAARYPVGQTSISLHPTEMLVVAGSLIAALLAALYPAWRAYRIDPGLSES